MNDSKNEIPDLGLQRGAGMQRQRLRDEGCGRQTEGHRETHLERAEKRERERVQRQRQTEGLNPRDQGIMDHPNRDLLAGQNSAGSGLLWSAETAELLFLLLAQAHLLSQQAQPRRGQSPWGDTSSETQTNEATL
jgi:hypothetical protein